MCSRLAAFELLPRENMAKCANDDVDNNDKNNNNGNNNGIKTIEAIKLMKADHE